MTKLPQRGQSPGDRVDVSGQLQAVVRSAAAAALRSMVATGLAAIVLLIALDVVCTWLVNHHASVWAAAVALTFTGITGALLAAYVVVVRAIGRGVIVGNERAQLGLLVLEATLSSMTDRGIVSADRVRSAGALARTARDQLSARIDGNVLTRWASRRVLSLATRLVGEKVTETLVASRGDVAGAMRDLSGSVTSWLSSTVTRWMRVQTFLACVAAVTISLLATALLAQT